MLTENELKLIQIAANVSGYLAMCFYLIGSINRLVDALRKRLERAARMLGQTPDQLAVSAITVFLAGVEERQPARPVAARAQTSLRDRVRAAYLRVTGGRFNEYVKLAGLRAELPGEDRSAVDQELKDFQKRREAVLYPLDDPRRITRADDAAAMMVSGERRDLFNLRY